MQTGMFIISVLVPMADMFPAKEQNGMNEEGEVGGGGVSNPRYIEPAATALRYVARI